MRDLESWGGGVDSKLSKAKFVVTHAQWLQGEVRRKCPSVDPARLVLAPVGVDTLKWVPESREARGECFVLATVGRLHHGKGHDVVIRALARLRSEGRHVRLVVMGFGPEREALVALCRELRISEVVEFTGSLGEDEVISRLRAADAFVLASRFDALGVVYMEAMALGLPAIGTDAGGVGEIITSGETGLLVPPRG